MEVYADNASTTQLNKKAFEEMICVAKDIYGNPSSLHEKGRESDQKISSARKQIAKILNCKPNEIIFTSGGTESNNMAITKLYIDGLKHGKNHIITTMIEHPSVYNTIRYLEKECNASVDYVMPDEYGHIYPGKIKELINEHTSFVSIMYANNEIGSLNDIKVIGEICMNHNIPLHTDAVQAIGHIDINLNDLNITMLSASAHKFGGMKGTGFLYVNSSYKSSNDFQLMYGGEQENGRRPGTENVLGIIAMASALKEETKKDKEYVWKLNRKIKNGLSEIDNAHINSDDYTLPGHISVSFDGIDGEVLLFYLDLNHVYVSSTSACSSHSVEPSRTLKAIGLSDSMAKSTVRISINNNNTEEEIDYLLSVLNKLILKLKK